MKRTLPFLFALAFSPLPAADETPLEISGVYPHLRMANSHGECGTGAVVPWQGDLWIVTYAPHMPNGSTDKLYRVSPDLEQEVFAGSVGGTPANRMIHRESNQLLIGPYLVDAGKNIRTIPPSRMFGRLTGNARHLDAPEDKVYYATMEEGLYEVDVNTLDVKCLIRDGNGGAPDTGIASKLPGYHGKGLYSGQGRLVYANNGDRDPRVKTDPTVPSGALAQWLGEGDWNLVRRNQFTEVTGPGGITGSDQPETDPIWAMGWDERSLLLGLLENRQWHYYRLPKGSHSYDGAHGWNTEWPRIREIGEEDLLATMHGTFWRFPAGFSRENSAGIAPRSNYLKVVGDFCRWNDRIVLGCDDSAQAEFLNKRPFKAEHAAPLRSNSNLWFVEPERLDHLGPAIGRGSVWLRQDVIAGETSDPYLFSGYDHRQLHLAHESAEEITFLLQVDREGTNRWTGLREVNVPPGEAVSLLFDATEAGAWINVTALAPATGVTAHFHYRERDERTASNDSLFAGIPGAGEEPALSGLMRSLSPDTLGLAVPSAKDDDAILYYEIDTRLRVVPVEKPGAGAGLVRDVRQPDRTYTIDEASVLLVEDGKRYRLPRGVPSPGQLSTGEPRNSSLAEVLAGSLTRGATVTASSTHEDYAAAHAVDGSLGEDSRWIGRSGAPSSIELDLGEPKTIRSLCVVTGWKRDSAYAARNLDIEVRVDGRWRALPGGAIRDNVSTEVGIALEEPVRTRHIRVSSPDPDFLRLYEIAAFDTVPPVPPFTAPDLGPARVCREVATERDLLNVGGTFYELPARNAQGLAKVRPIATHGLAIRDFCSHNGLLFLTGIDADTVSPRLFRSEDGRAAVWAGVVDDLWKLGKPRGEGGPWKDTAVAAGEPSDPYLMTGYDRKSFALESREPATIRLEVDVDGTGLWIPWKSFDLDAGGTIEGEFPEGFSAYWVRAISDSGTVATARFRYD